MKIKTCCLLLVGIFLHTCVQTRSCLHPSSSHDPLIVTYSKPGDKPYILRDPILEWYPTFSLYDSSHFNKFFLPDTPITFRNNPEKSIDSQVLKDLIEKFLQEIKAKKEIYSDFIILKKRGFNVKKQAGLLVVKSKKYPFVVKLFMENPRSYIRPYNKGFEPTCQFVVGGGITRHALGFTRIKNAEELRTYIHSDPELAQVLDVPRKWFWLPEKEEYFYIKGYNFGTPTPITAKVPAIYAVIADAIDIERTFSLSNEDDKEEALAITKMFDYTIDPHINNFVVEKETNKTVIIDTEHFPSLVGLKERPTMSSFFQYYIDLAKKYLKDRYGRLKSKRVQLQNQLRPFHTLD